MEFGMTRTKNALAFQDTLGLEFIVINNLASMVGRVTCFKNVFLTMSFPTMLVHFLINLQLQRRAARPTRTGTVARIAAAATMGSTA
jgi:hypothetical protein